jgi:hypothetical protein
MPEIGDDDFHVKTIDMGKFNTINLQKALAESMRELMGEEYGETAGSEPETYASDEEILEKEPIYEEEYPEEYYEEGYYEDGAYAEEEYTSEGYEEQEGYEEEYYEEVAEEEYYEEYGEEPIYEEDSDVAYEEKEAEFEEEQIREIERVLLLKTIDRKWMDHIDDMEQLRQGIGLQSYGQKNPLVEYKMIGYDMFGEMTKGIAENAWFQFTEDSLSRIKPYGTKFFMQTKLLSIGKKGIRVQHVKTGKEKCLAVDYVVLAMGVAPNSELKEQLEKRGIRCALVGDACRGGTIGNATQSAFHTALAI